MTDKSSEKKSNEDRSIELHEAIKRGSDVLPIPLGGSAEQAPIAIVSAKPSAQEARPSASEDTPPPA